MSHDDKFSVHTTVPEERSSTHILVVGSQLARSDAWFEALHAHKEYSSKPVYVSNERDRPDPFFNGIYTSLSRQSCFRRSVPYSYLNNQYIRASFRSHPKYLYSFMGRVTHAVRLELVRIDDDRSFILDTTVTPSFDFSVSTNDSLVSNQRQMVSVMSASKFVLSPRGVGLSSFRLYETLASGAVPVIISDSWCPPGRIPWDSCSIRVKESDVCRIPEILRQYESAWEQMSENVRTVYSDYLASDSLFNYLAEELADIPCGNEASFNRHLFVGLNLVYHVAARIRTARRRQL